MRTTPIAVILCAGLLAGCSRRDASTRSNQGASRPSTATSPAGDQPPPTAAGPLRIGVTLHPYYSWAKNIAGDLPDVTIVPILPGETDAGAYQPSTDDIAKLAHLDAVIINGIGHDDFIRQMIDASGNNSLTLIEVNKETPLLPSAHGDAPNSHTFISFTNAAQQTRLIAKKMAALRPAHAAVFERNAAAYADKLRKIQAAAAAQLAGAKIKRVVTVHDGYSYLLQEMGIELAGVVEPAHGLVPSAKELGELIDLVKKQHIRVILSEESFPHKLLDTLAGETGAKVYIISHIAVGNYSADEFEKGMQQNVDTLVKALVTDPT